MLAVTPPWLADMFSLVTTDPKTIEYILKTKFRGFPKGSYYKCIFDDLLGQGILNINPFTARRARSGSAIDLQEILIRFALDNLCTVGVGVDLCFLNPPGLDVEIAKAFEEAMDTTISRFSKYLVNIAFLGKSVRQLLTLF